MNRVRVLLADDHPMILEGFRAALSREFDLVGAVRDGRALLDAAGRLDPDVILLDISMPLLNGIDAAHQLKKVVPVAKLVFLTMHANPIYLKAALAAGASGYILKTCASDELAEAVRRVALGGTYVTPGFGEVLVRRFARDGGSPARSESLLTFRQREILQLVAEGRTAKEMAAILNVTVQTVAFHKYHIMNKVGLRTTAELTKFAIQERLAEI